MHTFDLDTYQVIIKESRDIKKLYIELTAECNFECKMCFRHSFPDPLGDMNDEIVDGLRQNIDALSNLKEVVFGGIGEALLHSRLKELIAFTKKKGLYVTVSTNGYLLDDHIDCFLENAVDKIVVSYESGDIGHPKDKNIWRAISSLTEKRTENRLLQPIVVLEIVVSKSNIFELDKLVPLIVDSGISAVTMSNLMPIDEEFAEYVLYPEKETEEVARFKKALLGRIAFYTPYFEVKTERNCAFLKKNAMVVRWDGEVAPCYRFLHRSKEVVLGKTKEIVPLSFGNIRDSSLLKIWNTRDYAWFRYSIDNSMYPSCIDCELRDGCQYTEDTLADCWGNENTCADCLWERHIIVCP